VAAHPWWRRLRRNFGISAPRAAVHTTPPWWGRALVLVLIAMLVAGLGWWAFDRGQLFGGYNRQEIETRLVTLEAEAGRARAEATELRTRNSQLETELAMTKGVQEALTRQATELSGQNAELKEQLAFLQKLFADTNRQAGVTISRLDAERQPDETWRYSLLVIRGGAQGEDFRGAAVLQATLAPTDPGQGGVRTVTLPEDQPASGPGLKLQFKYYQRIEGVLRVPSGTQLTSLTARIYEDGNPTPRATRTLSNP
jgi:hypothetical protein